MGQLGPETRRNLLHGTRPGQVPVCGQIMNAIIAGTYRRHGPGSMNFSRSVGAQLHSSNVHIMGILIPNSVSHATSAPCMLVAHKQSVDARVMECVRDDKALTFLGRQCKRG